MALATLLQVGSAGATSNSYVAASGPVTLVTNGLAAHDLVVLEIGYYQTVSGTPGQPITGGTYQGVPGFRAYRYTTSSIITEIWVFQVPTPNTSFVLSSFGQGTLRLTIDPAYDGALAFGAYAAVFSGSRVGGAIRQALAANATSAAAAVTPPGSLPTSLLLDVLNINFITSTALPSTPDVGQTLLARQTFRGTGDVTNRMQREIGIRPGGGVAPLSWTLASSKAWQLVAIEIPAGELPTPPPPQYTRRTAPATTFDLRPIAAPGFNRRRFSGWGLDWGLQWGGSGFTDLPTTDYSRRGAPGLTPARRSTPGTTFGRRSTPGTGFTRRGSG